MPFGYSFFTDPSPEQKMSLTLNPIELTRQLIQFATVNPPGNEDACARHVGLLLEDAGFKTAYHSFGSGRVCLVATIGGSEAKAPICFTGHLDVVPLGTVSWSHDPFAAEVVDGKLYGRGASDMKSGVAAMVVSAVELAKHLHGTSGLTLVFTGGEETGCEGAYSLVNHGLLDRAGAIVVGEPTANYPYVGHKGCVRFRCVCHGVTAHSSMPELGDNAIYKAARAISKLEAFQFKEEPHVLMGQPTLVVSQMRGGLNINSVPDWAEFSVDVRTIAEQESSAILSQIQTIMGPEVEVEPILDVTSVFTSLSDSWLQSVFALIENLTSSHLEARTATYFSDAAPLRIAYRSSPTVILGPGSPQMAHQTNEYCYVDKIEEATLLYTALMQEWCEV